MAGYDPTVAVREALANGALNAFVGAGLSRGAGLPDWYDLISGLLHRIGRELPPREYSNADTLIGGAQTYANAAGLNSMIAYLREHLDTAGTHPTDAHRVLAGLPISLVFTANFDDLLERAYREQGKRVYTVVRDRDIPFMSSAPNTVNVVKLYGSLDQPDTIVLASEQYETYFLDRPQMVKLLETEFGRRAMLYLGWSHSDLHYKLIFGEMLGRFGRFMRPGYAVMFDLPEDQARELERKQLQIVTLAAGGDRTAALAGWLGGLGLDQR